MMDMTYLYHIKKSLSNLCVLSILTFFFFSKQHALAHTNGFTHKLM